MIVTGHGFVFARHVSWDDTLDIFSSIGLPMLLVKVRTACHDRNTPNTTPHTCSLDTGHT